MFYVLNAFLFGMELAHPGGKGVYNSVFDILPGNLQNIFIDQSIN